MPIVLALLLLVLPIDGFPLGSELLREFGARPANILLLFVLGWIALRWSFHGRSALERGAPHALIITLLLVSIFNAFVPLFEGSSVSIIERSRMTQWTLQFLTIVWFATSIYVWLYIFRQSATVGSGYLGFLTIVATTTAVNVFLFVLDYTNTTLLHQEGGGLAIELLNAAREKKDLRPSGLATEPSVFGSWALAIWPLLLLRRPIPHRPLNTFSTAIGMLSILAAFLSGARTFMVIFLLQVIVLFFLIEVRRPISRKILFLLGLTLLVALDMSLWIFGYPSVLAQAWSAFDVESNFSSMTRIASAIAAVEIFLDYPLFGVGIGHFTAHYGSYVPSWALLSEEVQIYTSGHISHRVHTYNLFARAGAEMGILGFVLIAMIVIGPIAKLWKLARSSARAGTGGTENSRMIVGILLAGIGGAGYWMTQDHFMYQPGIFALSLCMYIVGQRYSAGGKTVAKRGSRSNRIRRPSEASQQVPGKGASEGSL